MSNLGSPQAAPSLLRRDRLGVLRARGGGADLSDGALGAGDADQRPPLRLGVLLVLIGGRTVFTGLLADLIVNVSRGEPQDFPLKYASDDTASPEG